jgi:hypothetical protein
MQSLPLRHRPISTPQDEERTMKPHIFRRDGTWNTFLPALNWTTPGVLVSGSFSRVSTQAASWWRLETERLRSR